MTRFLFPLLSRLPRPIVRRVAARYLAGETIGDMLPVVERLHAGGLLTTVDVLGENVDSEEEARGAVAEYLGLVDALSERRLESQVSVKPTLVGLRLGEDLALDGLERIAKRGDERGITLAIDMEDSTTTNATWRLYRRLRERHDRVDVAVQAYLPRSLEDVRAVLSLRPRVRVCKGIYVEPTGVAIENRQEIRDSFLALVTTLLDGGGYPAIATHDAWLVDRTLEALRGRGQGRGGRVLPAHEFQMLLGVGQGLRGRIRAAGSPLRVYSPYGSSWHAYSLRRLKENPRMFRYVLASALSPRLLRLRCRWGE